MRSTEAMSRSIHTKLSQGFLTLLPVALFLLAAACGGGSSGGGKGKSKQPPFVALQTVARQAGNVTIRYELQDVNDDLVDIQIRYSIDGGATFVGDATDGGGASEGKTGLAASPGGSPHTFVWAAGTDLGAGAFSNIVLEFTPTDAKNKIGVAKTTAPFVVGNDAPVVAFDPAQITSASGLVPFDYTLEDSTQDFCSVAVEFSIDGGVTYAPATIGVGTLTNLASGPVGSGVAHSLAWNSIADVGLANVAQTRLRLTPSDDFDLDGTPDSTGTAVASNDFALSNNGLPSISFLPVARQDGLVTIQLLVVDGESDLVDVGFEYSVDGGATWLGLTVDSASAGTVSPPSTVQGIPSSVAGALVSVVWNSTADVGGAATTALVRGTPSDPAGAGAMAQTSSFVVGNDVPVVAVTPITGAHDEGVIAIAFNLQDSTSDRTDLDVRYSTDGWVTDFPATVAVGVIQDVATAPTPGINYVIAWNSRTDLPNQTVNVELGLTPSDDATGSVEFGAQDRSGVFTVNNFDLPVAFLAFPSDNSLQQGAVRLNYLLFDAGSALLDIRVEYSTDGSPPSILATELVGPPSEGTTSLTSTPGGTQHIFVWDTATDLPGVDYTMVQLKITPVDGVGNDGVSSPATPAVFLLNNNFAPTVTLTTPGGQQIGDVAINYALLDAESDPVDLVAEYSLDGVTFLAASDAGPGAGSEGTTALTASPGGTAHVFVWDTVADGVAAGTPQTAVTFRLTPSDSPVPALGDGPSSQSSNFTVDNTTPPSVTIAAVANPTADDVIVDYTLFDPESQTQSVLVEFSTDGFSSDIRTATECAAACVPAAPASDGTSGLASSPGGTAHVFRWDSGADLGPARVTGVSVRITPSDTKTGAADVSNAFIVDNNEAPSATINTPAASQTGDVPISYALLDSNSDLCDLVIVEYSIDGGNTWFAATESPGIPSEGTTNLQSSPTGIGHFYVWNSTADVGLVAEPDVRFRLQPADTLTGGIVTSGPFAIDNTIALPFVLIDPVGRSLPDDVQIDYQIFDVDSDTQSVTVQWSDDNGVSWNNATECPSPTCPLSEGVSGLNSSPQGTAHTFVWDSATDLGSPGIAIVDLRVRITPTDNDGMGTDDTSNLFTRGNDIPSVTINAPLGGSQDGLIPIDFDLLDSTSDLIDINCQYDIGSGFLPATISAGSTVDLASSPGGTNHTIGWNSIADLGVANYTAVAFRITPGDFVADNGTADTVTFDVDNNESPIAAVATPATGDLRSGNVASDYLLIDGNSDTITLTVEFRTSSGGGFGAATIASTDQGSISGNQISGLSSSPAGVPHTYGWDSGTDFGAQDTTEGQLRITPDDGANTGAPALTGFFLVNNNAEPAIDSIDPFPPGDQSGDVTVTYALSDAESDPTDLAVTYSTDSGVTFSPATMGAGGDGDTALASSPGGTSHTYVWASDTDLAGLRETSVVLRLLPSDNPTPALGNGASGNTLVFVVDNTTAAPEARNLTNGSNGGTITMSYDLFDADPPSGPTVDLDVEYSVDGGVTILPATVSSPSEGVVNGNRIEGQTPSDIPPGAPKTFDWDSAADVGFRDVTGVLLYVTPQDSRLGPTATATFDVLNNDPPAVAIVDPSGMPTGDVIVAYTLVDTSLENLDITVEYRLDGGPFQPATESAGPPSDGTTGLSSGPPGSPAGHVYVWDSKTDLTTTLQTAVELRITATETSSPFATGSDISGAFSVENRIGANLVLGHDAFGQGGLDGKALLTDRRGDIDWDGTHLIISDPGNHRVLIFDSVPTANFQNADLVLGQADFSTGEANPGGPSATTVNSPVGVHSDGTSFYVADKDNNRVLIWTSFPTSNGQPADFVLGQADFSGSAADRGGAPAANTLDAPSGVYTAANQLFVSDTDNHRVLVWDIPGTWSNGLAANHVLGQPDFTSELPNRGSPTPSANSLYEPWGIYTDGVHLYVADRFNHRIIWWNTPGGAPPVWPIDLNADGVMGQPDFVSGMANNDFDATACSNDGNGAGLSRRTLHEPTDVFADGTNTVVTDHENHRVLIFNADPPPSPLDVGGYDNVCANVVLGQPNGKTAIPDNGGTDDDSLNRPFSAISTGSMVAIFDDTNSRVMIHDTFPVIDQEAADVVIFQPNLFSDDPNHIIANARSFNSPTSTRMAGGILFMTDDLHHRVLGWSTEPQVHNKAADIVLGQSNFDGSSAGDGANRMSRPRSLAHDPVGDRLFVCDKNNHRVLVFDGPFTVGMSASEWIGQTLDIDDTPGLSDTRMNGPEGLSYDGTNLWVVDKENHRVLRFPPAGQVRDGVADIVLGQPDFFSNTQNHGDADGTRGLDEPTGIVATGAEVIVGDRDNHRVMIWSPQPTLNNDPAAAIVLGQPDFTIPGVEGVSRTAMSFPSGVESDGTVLLIVDSNNHRTLIWDAMPTLNNEPADRIIGQPDFDTLLPNQGGVSEFSLYIGQRGLTKVAKPSLTGTTLWMPDQRNHRLLRYDIAP